MKQNLLTRWRAVLTALLVMVGLSSAFPASAYTLEYSYNNYNYTATVTGWSDIVSADEVVIPETVEYNNQTYSVTSIRDFAFDQCSTLTSITIPKFITLIGKSAFRGCAKLETVIYNPKNCELHYQIGNYVPFYNNQSIKKVTFGNEVEVIPASLFSGCSGLTSITIPNSVTSIGGYAFEGCKGLASVTIGESVASFGWDVFGDCDNLETVIYNAKNCSLPSDYVDGPFYNSTSIKNVTIGNAVEVIPANLFSLNYS